ncbi:MAG: hypothetical protein K2X86_13600 [Cytophagaceae bacterium]|nr:hypothetical protein [Cytophagaceae bacterium]
MRKILLLLSVVLLYTRGVSQGVSDDFNDNSLGTGWNANADYVLTETNQELAIAASAVGPGYENFIFTFPSKDISSVPFVKLNMKSAAQVNVRIDLIDGNGKVTNNSPIVKAVPGTNTYGAFTYNFYNLFSQSYPPPNVVAVDPTDIVGMIIFFKPGGTAFSGTVYFDDLQIGSATGLTLPPAAIRLNQIGFYPSAVKTAIAVNASAGPFYIVSADKQDTLYTGTLGNAATWSPSGESVRKADFTSFITSGSYYINVPGLGYSHLFDIKNAVHHDVAKATLKAFYFQRASTALTAPYAGD